MPDPHIIVIKVTTQDPKHSYYAHFTRDTHTLLEVQEYKTIYTPKGLPMPPRIRNVVVLARTKLETLATTGENSEDHV